MGLDMYLRRVTKPELEDRFYTRNELDELRISTREVDDDLCEAIRNNSVMVDIIDQRYVNKKLAEAAGVDYSKVSKCYIGGEFFKCYIGGESFNKDSHKIAFCFLNEKEELLGRVTIDADDKNYLEEVKRTMLAFILEEVDYQRKGLNEYGIELLPEDCKECDDFKVVEALVEHGGLSGTFIDNWEDGRTIFVAWW